MALSKTFAFGLVPALAGGIGTYHLLAASTYTFSQTFAKKNWTVVDANTTEEQLGNILLGRMFPHHRQNYTLEKDQLFKGSPELEITGETKENLFILKKSSKEDLEKLRNACIKALSSVQYSDDSQEHRLREWCTISKVEDVLRRHKMEIAKTDEQWKKILEGDWMKEGNKDKQSFFNESEWKYLTESGKEEKEKIKILRDKCRAALKETYKRENFPFPTSKDKSINADAFQEAALFCTVPMTAEEYVKKAMKGTIKETLSDSLKTDYCHIKDKTIDDYKAIKTTDPMEGKSFWCAVRLIHLKSEQKPT